MEKKIKLFVIASAVLSLTDIVMGAIWSQYLIAPKRVLIGCFVTMVSVRIMNCTQSSNEYVNKRYAIVMQGILALTILLNLTDFIAVFNNIYWKNNLLLDYWNSIAIILSTVIPILTFFRMYKNGFSFFKK